MKKLKNKEQKKKNQKVIRTNMAVKLHQANLMGMKSPKHLLNRKKLVLN
jgi:hypothetical protein